jgi:cytoskeletal protein RodZ
MRVSDNARAAASQIICFQSLDFCYPIPLSSSFSLLAAMPLTIAQQLKAAREQRGLSLADAAHETRIPAIRLAQMEEGNFAVFGNMAYARSFVSLYAKFLGVSSESFVANLPKPVLGGADDYRYLTTSFGPWIEPVVRHRVRARARVAAKETGSVGLHAMLIFLGIAACMSILGLEFFSPKGVGSINKAPMSSATSPAPKRVTVVTASVSPQASVGSQPLASGKKVVFSKSPPKGAPQTPPVVAVTTPHKAKPAAPAAPAEEIRVPDVGGVRVMRAEPVIDLPTNPSGM